MRRIHSRVTLRLFALALFCLLIVPGTAGTLDLSTATVADLQQALASGALTSEKLVQLYLARIAAYDQQGPTLNTIITLNAHALEEARALDAERKSKGPRSPLHGLPIMAKDVFDTKDMPTSGGFAPMATSQPARDAFVINRLREAGAIILAKLNQADWYGNAPSGSSTRGGRVLSPYNPAKYGGGSSSGTGSAMAAWLATVGMGSDTTGSILNPSAHSNLVGISATHGLVSRTGMMWSSPTQENGGPMGRSVYDCAAVLDVIAGYDPADLGTAAGIGHLPDRPYTSFVDPQGLRGARIGVVREMVRTGEGHAEGVALFDKAVADLRAAGAVVVDPALTGIDLVQAQFTADTADFERAAAIEKYLSGLPPTAPIRSVAEMIEKGGSLVKPAIIETARLSHLERNAALAAVYRQQEMLRTALGGLMEKYQLDALVLPYRTYALDEIDHMPRNSWQRPEVRNHLASSTGFPTIIVPGGFFPSDHMPFGLQFIGRPFAEPTLIKLASGYEAATHHRKAPAATPALADEKITF